MNIISERIFEILPPNEKISVIDCGAKGGTEAEKWSFSGDRVIIYGFDPDEDECTRLNSEAEARGLQHYYYPICLGQSDQQSRKFYMTKQAYSHSLYQPDEKQVSRWKQFQEGKLVCTRDNLGIDKVTEIQTTSLDTWADTYNIAEIDFIKMDVQGAELEILKGAKKLLQTVLGMEVEVEFVPLYVDQPLFADVDIFLRKEGFSFFDFNFLHNGHFVGRMLSPVTVMHESNNTVPCFQTAGQLCTADALYLLDPIDHRSGRMRDLPVNKILKLVCISEVRGQIEYAFELLVWLRGFLISAGNKHDAEIIEQVYNQATEQYQADIATMLQADVCTDAGIVFDACRPTMVPKRLIDAF